MLIRKDEVMVNQRVGKVCGESQHFPLTLLLIDISFNLLQGTSQLSLWRIFFLKVQALTCRLARVCFAQTRPHCPTFLPECHHHWAS